MTGPLEKEVPMPMRKDDSAVVRRPPNRTRRSRPSVFKELDIVRLSRDFVSPGGVIRKGTEATVLQVFGDGLAYQVEFEGPHEVPETVPADSLEARLARSA